MPESDDDADLALIFRIMDKEEAALGEFLERYGPKLKGYIRKKFGDELLEPEIEQAIIDSAEKVWRFSDKFDPENGTFRGWVITIAFNSAVDILRAERRHQAKSLEYDPGYNPADCYENSGGHSDLKDARLKVLDDFIFNKLTGFEKIVAVNCFKAGGEADSRRLAAIHGKARGNVDTVKSKVKAKIRQALLEWESQQKKPKGKP